MLAADYDAPARRVLGDYADVDADAARGTPRYRLLLLRRERQPSRAPAAGGLPASPATPTEAKRANATNATSSVPRTRARRRRRRRTASRGERRRSSSPRTRSRRRRRQKIRRRDGSRSRLTQRDSLSAATIVPIVRRSEPRRPGTPPRLVAGGFMAKMEAEWVRLARARRGARRALPPPPRTPRLRRRRRRPRRRGTRTGTRRR